MAEEMTGDQFKSALTSSDKPILIDFWAVWCAPCRHQGQILDKWFENNQDKVFLGKINVDQENAIAAEYGISSIPTLILFSNGKEVARAVGVQRDTDLDDMLTKA